MFGDWKAKEVVATQREAAVFPRRNLTRSVKEISHTRTEHKEYSEIAQAPTSNPAPCGESYHCNCHPLDLLGPEA